MNNTVTLSEVIRHFAQYINRVFYKGEHFILLRGKKPVAELRPVSTGKRLGELPALLESLPHLSEEEADEFARDLSEARSQLLKEKRTDPWEF
jgi:antitoxin (DNA-binding transcriptional repressor) of toxin-antitoxin stability system